MSTLLSSLQIPKPLKGIIFDCDGVIINSKAANAMYFNKVLEAFNLPPLTEEQEAFTFMSTVPQALEFIIPAHLHSQIAEVCSKTVSYQRDIMPHVELQEYFQEFAAWLGENNIRCAVHTNRSNGMQYVVDKFSFLEKFSPIITASDVTPKPDPAGVFAVLSAWNLQPHEILFVGDSYNDQQAAAGAKVPFVAFENEKLDATVNIGSFKALQNLLRDYIA